MSIVLSEANFLHQLIKDELDAMRNFAQLLDTEQAILVENRSAELESVTTEKNKSLSNLLALEKTRNAHLEKNAYAKDAEGMRQLLALCDNVEMNQHWNMLLEISADAQEANRTNGLLIQRHLSRNQATLNILHQNDQAGSMYGSDGQSKTKFGTSRGIVAR
ncbi:MAG: flagellar protein FlgN [Undibacterium sp.]|nr:flagellar protein FlgN [Undibacterium sp.]